MAHQDLRDPALGDAVARTTFVITMVGAALFIGIVFLFIL